MAQFAFEVKMFFPENQDKQEFFDELQDLCEKYGDEVEVEEI